MWNVHGVPHSAAVIQKNVNCKTCGNSPAKSHTHGIMMKKINKNEMFHVFGHVDADDGDYPTIIII